MTDAQEKALKAYQDTKDYAVSVIALASLVKLGLGREEWAVNMFHEFVSDIAEACGIHPREACSYAIEGIDELVRAVD